MLNKLTTKKYWKQVWKGASLPITEKPGLDIQRILHRKLPKSDRISLVEIGCAPGKWMAYFHQQFDYLVSGIEYEEEAAALTEINMKMQGIPAEVLEADFFDFEIMSNKYDIVFSSGFVEHFDDLRCSVGKICSLAKRYVVTIVPNCYGVNGWISKTVRPRVFNGHMQIDKHMLRRVHEDCGLKTLFCDYTNGLQFIKPAAYNEFFAKHKLIALAINIPFGCFNFVSKIVGDSLHWYPRTKLLSNTIMYLGVKLVA